MDKFYAASLAVDLTRRAIDNNSISLNADAAGAKLLADFIIALAKHLEASDLPDELPAI